MQVYHSVSELDQTASYSSSVAIGNFDGMHLGHQKLILTTVEYAHSHNSIPTALTFFPHPSQILKPSSTPLRLTTLSEKIYQLEKLNIEKVLVANFDKSFMNLEANEFFDLYLLKALKAKSIHVGFDFRFGKNRAGDIPFLKQLCDKNNIQLSIQEPFLLEGQKVSSTLIRENLRNNNIEQANKLLGRPYSVWGTVVPGAKKGSQLGFPTANLSYSTEKVVPTNGVYATKFYTNNTCYESVTNVGVRPTLHSEAPAYPVIETHLFNFQNNLYDSSAIVEFLFKVREEKKFNSLEELRKQIEKDIEKVKGFFKRS